MTQIPREHMGSWRQRRRKPNDEEPHGYHAIEPTDDENAAEDSIDYDDDERPAS
jgi:hypothetical protein